MDVTSTARPRPTTTAARPSATTARPRPTTPNRASSSTSSSSVSPSSTPIPEEASSSKGGLPTAAIAGIAAAGALILLFAISVIFCKKRRTRIYANQKHTHDPSRDPINPLDVLPPLKKDPNTPDLEEVPISLAALQSARSAGGRGPPFNGPNQPHYEDHSYGPEEPGRGPGGPSGPGGAPGYGPDYDREGSVVQSELSYRQTTRRNDSPGFNQPPQNYSPAMGPQGRGPPNGSYSSMPGSGPTSPSGYPNQRPPQSPPFPGPGPSSPRQQNQYQYQPPAPGPGYRSPPMGPASPNHRAPPNF
ncbi:hypothetical protein BGZ93_002043 [Podila epicladia]|nr:hypothetical protein BGZ92_004805 [Podila epicladia]KAG0083081.1 hypothetical protein BGZ93_002043 [Podila epicladia]